MKNLFLFGLLLFPFSRAKAQPSINLPLKHELDSIMTKDQLIRGYLSAKLDSIRMDSISRQLGIQRDKFDEGLSALMERTDSSNLVRVEQILAQYGYPGKSLVGDTTNKAAFLVIQHSPKVGQYLPLIETAANLGEIPFDLYAMMKDRFLVYNNQPQIWGTQAITMEMESSATGKRERRTFIWPIEDPTHVNDRRRKAGFPKTVEEYAKKFGIDYSVITMQQVIAGKID